MTQTIPKIYPGPAGHVFFVKGSAFSKVQLQIIANEPKLQISAMISVKKLSS
jgi:hypothetical protein